MNFFLQLPDNGARMIEENSIFKGFGEGEHGSRQSEGKVKKLITDVSWCKGCGVCVAFCPKQVLEVQHGKIVIARPNDCIRCGQCELRCPDYAIYLEDVTEEENE